MYLHTRTQFAECDQRKCKNCSGKTALSKHCGEASMSSSSEGEGEYSAIRAESAQSDSTEVA